MNSFEKVAGAAKLPEEHEHVTPYYYRHPELFKIGKLTAEEDFSHYRWTVDTPEDLEFLQKVAAHFSGRDDFSWLDVLEVVEAHPELSEINAQVRHKDYREVDERR